MSKELLTKDQVDEIRSKVLDRINPRLFTEKSFWEKLYESAKKAGKEIIEKALYLYYASQSPETPEWAKAVIYSALVYFIFPIDAIPDFTPLVGYSDDLLVLTAALIVVAMHINPEVKRQAKNKMNDIFG